MLAVNEGSNLEVRTYRTGVQHSNRKQSQQIEANVLNAKYNALQTEYFMQYLDSKIRSDVLLFR